MYEMSPRLLETDFPEVRRERLRVLQANLGYRCNQRCLHCHVNAGPNRKELMAPETVTALQEFLAVHSVETLDLTGGAPELHPQFRELVSAARSLGVRVIDRCNLTVLNEPGQEGTAEFLAEQGVEIVASLPCYLQENVDAQRGTGTYAASIGVLRRLNELGYGKEGGDLALNLMYNPAGPVLPPPQPVLEADYRRELMRLGISFHHLYVLANMPIHRFGSTLVSRGQYDDYMALLKGAFQECNLSTVMCRTLLSVDWRGRVYDCDFNQMLELPLGAGGTRLADLMSRELDGTPITVGEHCWGCTAGQGSSCGGALTDA